MSGNAEKDFPALIRVEEMCIESCDPESMEAWDKVKATLLHNRNSLKHTHVAGDGKDIDTCKLCGLDLRNDIHNRQLNS